MTRFLLRRIVQMIPLLIGISILAFLIIRLAPGDPTSVYIDPNKPPPSEEDLARLRADLGLDDPLPVQYVQWLKNAVQGDLGFSLSGRRPVTEEIGERLPNTALLGLSSLLLTMLISIPVGILSAVYRYTLLDYTITF
ncbi:MAG: ABC transporter permease, partial [Anaerolineae bacterium]|nr:ABC transporter permease [Anaerolineae bacterium]